MSVEIKKYKAGSFSGQNIQSLPSVWTFYLSPVLGGRTFQGCFTFCTRIAL